MAKSIVDHTKVTIDELLYMVTDMIGADNLEEVEAFVKQLKQVWSLLENKIPKLIEKELIENNLSNLVEIELSLKFDMKEVM